MPSVYLKTIVSLWGVKPSKIRVIYNAFEIPELADFTERTDRGSLRQKLEMITTASPVIISVGRLVPWKGFMALIETVAHLHKAHPDLVLYIAGTGPQEQQLKTLVHNMGLEKRVIFLGRLEHGELMKYIKAADMLVLNTAYEGLSHLLLETMALGTPIITTAVGGNTELIQHGREGLLVQYNDRPHLKKAIETLIYHPLYAAELGCRAEKKVQSFTKERMLVELSATLKHVAHSKCCKKAEF